MFFLLTAKDGTDEGAPARRQEARPAHLSACELLKKQGKMLFGAALLDEGGRMIGSVIVLNVDSRQDVDKYLESEAYVVGKVWQDIQVQAIAVGNLFLPEGAKV